MLVVAPAPFRSIQPASRVGRARDAAERLSGRLEQDGFSGWDPYDALSSPLLHAVSRSPLLRRTAIQSLKRSPLNVRPLLAVPKRRHTKALALLTSAYLQLDRRDLAFRLRDQLLAAALPGAGWGYEFDVQTRWGYYRARQPNAVVTAFAAHALLDTLDLEASEDTRTAVDEALEFVERDLLVQVGEEAFFAYFAGGDVPIHNSNLLVASLFARAGTAAQRDVARRAVQYTVERQRSDGTWPYGERPGLEWVDGFHTAYVLERLVQWNDAQPEPTLATAIERGTDAYVQRLIDPDGAPRSTIQRRFPIDVHAAASAITALCRLQEFHARARETADAVLDWTLANMVRADGRFSFQRHRSWTNRTAYVRWSDAHMLLALANYLDAAEGT